MLTLSECLEQIGKNESTILDLSGQQMLDYGEDSRQLQQFPFPDFSGLGASSAIGIFPLDHDHILTAHINSLRVWNIKTGEFTEISRPHLYGKPPHHKMSINFFRVLENNQLLVTYSDGNAFIYDWRTTAVIKSDFRFHGSTVNKLSDGRFIDIQGTDNAGQCSIYISNLETDQKTLACKLKLAPHSTVSLIAILDNQQIVLSQGFLQGGTYGGFFLYLVALQQGKVLVTQKIQGGSARHIASQDYFIYFSEQERVLNVMNLKTLTQIYAIRERHFNSSVTTIVKNSQLITCNMDRGADLWNLHNGQHVQEITQDIIRRFVSLGGTLLACIDQDLNISLYDLSNKTYLQKLCGKSSTSILSVAKIAENKIAIMYFDLLKIYTFSSRALQLKDIDGLLLALRGNQSIVKLNLMGINLGNEGARKVANLITHNNVIQHIDLSNTGISDEGAQALLTALRANKSLRTLNLAGNTINASLYAQIQLELAKRLSPDQNKKSESQPSPAATPPKPEIRDKDGNTLLHQACLAEDVLQVKTLLGNGADVHATNAQGNTPLHVTALTLTSDKSLEIARLLLEQGADSNLSNYNLQTPLEVITAPKSHREFIQLLLSRRLHWRKEYLDTVIIRSLIQYRGDFQNRTADKTLLDTQVSHLTGCDVALLMEQYKWTYLGHLNSIKGKYKRHTETTMRKFEGFWPKDFLPLRIRILFEIVIQIEAGILSVASLPTPDLTLPKLKQEIITELETLRARRDSLFIHNQLNDDANAIEAHAWNIARKVMQVTEAQHYCYYTGFVRHSIYLSFSLQTLGGVKRTIPRLDNLGGSCWHHETKASTSAAASTYRYPYAIDVPPDYFTLSQAQPPPYLINIIKAVFLDSLQANPLLYATSGNITFPKLSASLVSGWWPAKMEQTVGNCTVKNHNIGLQIRLQLGDPTHQLYHWLREMEVRFIPIKLYGAPKQGFSAPDLSFIPEEFVREEQSFIADDLAEQSTTLHRAIAQNDIPTIKRLISEEANVNAVTKQGYTPLHIAAFYGFEEAIEILLQSGANSNLQNRFGETPLSLALWGKHTSIIRLLTNHEVRQEQLTFYESEGYTPLHRAIEQGDSQTVKRLLSEKIDTQAITKKGYTYLHLAAIQGDAALIELLVMQGAFVDARTLTGNTPLLLATFHGHPDAVRKLLEYGANLELANNKSVTPYSLSIDLLRMNGGNHKQIHCQSILETHHHSTDLMKQLRGHIDHLEQRVSELETENAELRLMLNSGSLSAVTRQAPASHQTSTQRFFSGETTRAAHEDTTTHEYKQQ